MGRQLSEKELKRFGRVIKGHAADKDRARWKLKHKGAAPARERPRKGGREEGEDESLDEALQDRVGDEP